MTGWYSSSWKARSLEYGEGGGFPPPFSYATKQSGGDKTHRPPDTAVRLRPTKQPVCFTTERAVCDNYKNLGLCARAENQKRTEQIFCCTVKMSVASKRRHDHAFLKHVFAEKQLLQGRKYDTISKVKNCRPLPWNAQRIRAAIFLRVPKKQRQSFRLVFFTHL